MVWAGPDLDIKAGPEQTWPRKGRGDLFPPSNPPACKMIFVLYAGGDEDEKTKMKEMLEGKEELAWRRRCLCWSG
jgi:hypothetical protein